MAKKKDTHTGLPSWLQAYDLAPVDWAGVRVFVGVIPAERLELNEGQLEGLEKNPRQWTRDELENLKKSIIETPELTAARGCAVYPFPDREAVITLGGNMRLTAIKELGLDAVPVIVYPEDTPNEKLVEIVIKDNGSFGGWDFDELANKWDNGKLHDWGVPAWAAPTGEVAELQETAEPSAESVDLDEMEKNVRMTFEFTPDEWAFVNETLAMIDPNKENALLKYMNYQSEGETVEEDGLDEL